MTSLPPYTTPVVVSRHSLMKYPPSSFWILGIFILQFICQLGLTVEFLSPFRIVFRTAGYGINLVALFLAYGPKKQFHHPAFWISVFIPTWIALQFLNPTTNTVMSAVATFTFYIAIIAPIFWVPRLQITPDVIRTVIMMVWMFQTVSSLFGVLQVYFPGQFQPAISQLVTENQFGGTNLQIRIADGTTIFRPMGLSDMPGGAASAGMYTFVFGLSIFALSRRISWAIAAVATMPVGLFCIYISQTRSTLIIALLIAVAFSAVLFATQRLSAAIRTACIIPIMVVTSLIWAFAMGGQETRNRFESLFEDRFDEVYMKNRGGFVQDTIENGIPEFPFGAGLGRWGQMLLYFGDPNIDGSFPLWVEVQWTAWLFDGGVVLMGAYALAMVIAIFATARVAFDSSKSEVCGWGMLVLSYDVAIMAITFSFVPFSSGQGIEFWILNAMVWTAWKNQQPARNRWVAG